MNPLATYRTIEGIHSYQMNNTHNTNKQMMNGEEGLLAVTEQRDREIEERRKKQLLKDSK